mmetsp:Transcript_24213/g.48151  ORF Transcript_24213/g.48151 Transcript_24213/m.48151 type:complete len:403 (-) Transcript_24213:101-1309(-)|eukprot:CAMPEP_0182452844 /NCGR_PEP_ID=MMETSP1319-20130603/164_1 /TAXON_ID=172717 /ORGANISM="Bolidomonas pacifica, Strain RCC208" /LENGTH=402 /DNA_ID=CAMNT_0024650721 /DNA_START=1207 /DNA_END=2415 /DNA_ORIENTATION=-
MTSLSTVKDATIPPPGFATLDEAHQEMLDCARYGDVEDLRQLLCHPSVSVNHAAPGSGNTALHLACANGEAGCVEVVLARPDAEHRSNESGNYPLHYASLNGHLACVNKLLERFKDIDVLAKNEFGKSSLTEGFKSEVTEVVGALLEHDSSTEDKLLQGVPTPETVEANQLLSLDLPPRLQIRELSMTTPDSPFTSSTSLDSTGQSVWSCSIVAARFFASREFPPGSKILELGSGCGVPGLAVSCSTKTSSESSVLLSDFNPRTLDNLRHNAGLNAKGRRSKSVDVANVDWSDPKTHVPGCTHLLGCDLVYTPEIVAPLLSAVEGCSESGTTMMYSGPTGGRAGIEDFLKGMEEGGWKLEDHRLAGEDEVKNPLESGDEDMAFLCFQELKDMEWGLWLWVKE